MKVAWAADLVSSGGGLGFALLGDDPDARSLLVEHGQPGLCGEEGVGLGEPLDRVDHLHPARHHLPELRR